MRIRIRLQSVSGSEAAYPITTGFADLCSAFEAQWLVACRIVKEKTSQLSPAGGEKGHGGECALVPLKNPCLLATYSVASSCSFR